MCGLGEEGRGGRGGPGQVDLPGAPRGPIPKVGVEAAGPGRAPARPPRSHRLGGSSRALAITRWPHTLVLDRGGQAFSLPSAARGRGPCPKGHNLGAQMRGVWVCLALSASIAPPPPHPLSVPPSPTEPGPGGHQQAALRAAGGAPGPGGQALGTPVLEFLATPTARLRSWQPTLASWPWASHVWLRRAAAQGDHEGVRRDWPL